MIKLFYKLWAFLIKERKNDTLFIRLIIYNNFNYVDINNYLIKINLNSFLILFNLIKLIKFNDYINIINKIL